MEALVVAIPALVALVLIDAGYWIAISLMRWIPVLIVSSATGWFALRGGLAPTEALVAGAFAGLLARHLRRRAEAARDRSE